MISDNAKTYAQEILDLYERFENSESLSYGDYTERMTRLGIDLAGEVAADDLIFFQEWRVIVFDKKGERVHAGSWFSKEENARSFLNDEYPEPNAVGAYWRVQTRWISESRTVN